MKHRPQLPDDSVNVSAEHPLREALRLGAAFAVIAVALYVVTGWLVDVVVDRLDPDTGRRLLPQISSVVVSEYGEPLETPRARRTHELFAALLSTAGRDPERYALLVLDNDMVNAMALPGRLIVVFGGLLDEVRSENELAMILGHELGHLDNKDHLRLLGRGILAAGVSALVFGNANALDAHLLSLPSHTLQRRFGQTRERLADETGLALLCEHYGHSGGAVDFFERHVDSDTRLQFLATHPASAERVAALRAKAAELECDLGARLPL